MFLEAILIERLIILPVAPISRKFTNGPPCAQPGGDHPVTLLANGQQIAVPFVAQAFVGDVVNFQLPRFSAYLAPVIRQVQGPDPPLLPLIGLHVGAIFR